MSGPEQRLGNVPPPVSAVAGLPTALLSDCLDRFQAMDASIRRLSGQALVGPAFCVQGFAGDNVTIHQALTLIPPGYVLVVDADGCDSRAVWGDVLTEAAIQRGVAGLVVSGLIRDLEEIMSRSWPVFGRGTAPGGPHKSGRGRIGYPIQVGGVVVSPGDVVVGDADGVVVVPAERLGAVAELAEVRQEQEAVWKEQIRDGLATVDVLHLPCDAVVHPDVVSATQSADPVSTVREGDS